MYRTRIKICGITRDEDARYAVELGADALGFNFYPPSSRYLDPGRAAELSAAVGPLVTRVGVFFDPTPELVAAVLADVELDLLQFHGGESNAFCGGFGLPFIKGARIGHDGGFAELRARYPDARGWLLDSMVPGLAGGTGQTFDWARIPEGARRAVILAGGLDSDNVGLAVRTVRPYAVDVSSGVESSGGIKSAAKMKQFFEAVNEADASMAEQDRHELV